MINILLCGNKKVFDGALTQLISMTNRTKEPLHVFLMTMNLERVREDFVSITDEQVDFLNHVLRKKNPDNVVEKLDVTDLYEQEFHECVNETAYCTPYTLLRLLADMIPDIPDKLLYLDIDIMKLTLPNGRTLEKQMKYEAKRFLKILQEEIDRWYSLYSPMIYQRTYRKVHRIQF